MMLNNGNLPGDMRCRKLEELNRQLEQEKSVLLRQLKAATKKAEGQNTTC
jgi:hypothetical protein